MTHPRLIASDLDGTLLRNDGTVSERTMRVWRQLAEAGMETVLVTARPPRWLHHLHELVGAHGVAICANGAFVYDIPARRIVEADGFTADEAIALSERILTAHPAAGVAVETDRGMFRTAAYPDPHANNPVHHVPGSDDVTDCELTEVPTDAVIGKILVMDTSWESDEFVDDLSQLIGSTGVLAYSGASGLAEISAPGVTKAKRLAQWCAQRDVAAADVWAFGDMPNDIPMLTWVGRGIAVANAHPDVTAIADAVCESNESDGVAATLEALLASRDEGR